MDTLLNQPINIKIELVSILKKTIFNKFNIMLDTDLLNIYFVNKNNVDYSMQLIKLQKYLEANNVTLTCRELFDVLITNLKTECYITKFDRNSLNVNISPNYICKLMQPYSNNNIIKLNENKHNILVDFSSPNIAKDMHVGHLRSTIIGDSICKLYELQGNNVNRINHIGDFGLQFGMIIQHLLEKYPDYNNYNLSISDLQQFYAESKKRFDTDSVFKQNAYQKVVQLQSNDVEVVEAWNFIKEISRRSYNDIYEKLDIKLFECGESFYQSQIPSLIKELEFKNLLVEEDGRKIIRVKNYDLPLTVVKTDSGYTYDTTDLAAVRYRLVELNMDKVIYVVDEGQTLHFELIFKIAEMAGWKRADQELKHVGFGLVCGSDGKKFASRSGDTIKLKDLLSESIIKSGEAFDNIKKLKEEALTYNHKPIPENNMPEDEKQNIIKTVAYSSIKYADLSTIRTNNYQFSFEKMLSLKGNTGVYQLYEYVRICAIVRNAKHHINNIDYNTFVINEKEEINVCKQLLLFPEIIESINDNLMFHHLCVYLYALTGIFSVFHKKCRCLYFNKDNELIDVDKNRLLICVITKSVMEKCFHILGINTLEKM